MVVLEAFGLAAAEMWNYNRELFKFDQEQRLKRDLERVEMQIKQFDLFREDIEDLVELTVSKMDMYHMVGALMLAFTCTIYTEGLFRGIEPPWFTGLYYMFVCDAFVFLLLAVWLSMHASVQAQSYGVRLRTRYVRLPIPSLSFLNDLTSKFADFERQGLKHVLRLPFTGTTPGWKRREQLDSDGKPKVRRPGEWRDAQAASTREFVMKGTQANELVGRGDDGFGKEEIFQAAAQTLPGRHVQLFRRLQAKWQCYDAYARVSMSIGVNQMIQAVNFFVIGSSLVERTVPTCAVAATLIFQTVCLGLAMLDIAEKPISSKLPIRRGGQIMILQGIGSAPAVITTLMLMFGRRKGDYIGALDPLAPSFFPAPVCFFFQALWFQLMLIVALPSRDEATLPRKFLAVLFLDVFGDASYDPTEAEQADAGPALTQHSSRKTEQETMIALVEEAMVIAQAALRRWEAIPRELLTPEQVNTLERLREEYRFWRQRVQAYVCRKKMERGVAYDPAVRDGVELRTWNELSELERDEDPYSGYLVGPLVKRRALRSTTFYYDLDLSRHIQDSADGRSVLDLESVESLVQTAAERVREAIAKDHQEKNGGQQRMDPQGSSDSDADLSGESSDSSLEGGRITREVKDFSKPAKERLPWKTIKRLTHVLTISWSALGLLFALENTGVVASGWLYGEEGEENAESDENSRRLSEAGNQTHGTMAQTEQSLLATLQEMQTKWPHGGFVRPTHLSYVQASDDAPGSLLLGSSYQTFQVSAGGFGGKFSSAFAPLPRRMAPAGTQSICTASTSTTDSFCLFSELLPDGSGIALWSAGGHRASAWQLKLEHGRTWRTFSGALLPCHGLEALIPFSGAAVSPASDTCLVLTGLDDSLMPIAVLPASTKHLAAAATAAATTGATSSSAASGVASGLRAAFLGGRSDHEEVLIRPRADLLRTLPMSRDLDDVAARIRAVHVSPTSGQLWALVRAATAPAQQQQQQQQQQQL